MVSVSVDIGTASVSMCATSVRGDRQRQPQPPPQYCEQAVGKAVLTGDGAEPMPQRVVRPRQQLGFAKLVEQAREPWCCRVLSTAGP